MPSESSWKIWDYFRVNSFPLGIEAPSGIYCFYCSDSFIEKILVTKIRAGFRNLGGELSVTFASEMSADWFEEEYFNLQLFSENRSYIVYQAEAMPKHTIQFLQDNTLTVNDRTLVFIFNKKNDFYKAIAEQAVQVVELEEPKHWEWDKVFHFIAQEMRVPVPYDVQEYILNNKEQSCGDFVAAINMIRNMKLDGQIISLENIKKIISPSKIEQFELAKLFSAKRRKEFYKKLIWLDITYKDWNLFFSFMQSHLLKLAGPELLQKKKRLTQYDKQIINDACLWTLEEINLEATKLGRLQILAKKNDSFLRDEIRLAYINSL